MRLDCVFVAIHDTRGPDRSNLEAAVAGFDGVPASLKDGPLHAVSARPPGDLPQADCLLDGHVDNLADFDVPQGTVEQQVHHLWMRDGDGVLAELRGEFAVLLWNRSEGRGVVVRDQLGGRPLFLHTAGSRTTFASELRPLLHALPTRPAPDDVAVALWLAGDSYLGGRTLHEGITRVGPGRLVQLRRDGIQEQVYWRPTWDGPLEGSQDEIIGALREGIGAAVARALAGARQPAVLLSGGLDSTTVVAHAARTRPDTRGYSATFPNHPEADESELIRDVANRLGIDAVEAQPRSGSVFAGAIEYLRRWEAPDLSVTSWFWTGLLRRAAEDGVDVLLDGEGGDELFMTRTHAIADAVAARDLRRAWQLVSAFPTIGTHPGRKLRLRILAEHGVLSFLPTDASLFADPESPLLRPSTRRAVAAVKQRRPWRHLDGPRSWAAQAHYVQFANDVRGAAEHLGRLARMGGVTERHPLLDLDLVRLTWRLPPEYTYSATANRVAERMAMAGVLPDSVRLRSKKTFFDSLRSTSAAGPDLPVLQELLGPDARVRRWLQPREIDKLSAGPPSDRDERNRWSHHILEVAKTEAWLRYQEDPLLPERILARLPETVCEMVARPSR